MAAKRDVRVNRLWRQPHGFAQAGFALARVAQPSQRLAKQDVRAGVGAVDSQRALRAVARVGESARQQIHRSRPHLRRDVVGLQLREPQDFADGCRGVVRLRRNVSQLRVGFHRLRNELDRVAILNRRVLVPPLLGVAIAALDVAAGGLGGIARTTCETTCQNGHCNTDAYHERYPGK